MTFDFPNFFFSFTTDAKSKLNAKRSKSWLLKRASRQSDKSYFKLSVKRKLLFPKKNRYIYI